MTDEQYYKILGVKLGASEQEIKDAYKFLAQSLHPDKFATHDHKRRAEEKLKELNAARDQILKSMKNPNSEQTNRPASYQPSGVSPVPPKAKSKKLGVACLTITVGILALLFITFGVSIYVGKNFLGANNNSSKEDSENATKLAEFTFTPNFIIDFESPDPEERNAFSARNINNGTPRFRVRPLELSAYSNNKFFLKVSICNIGTAAGTLSSLNFWYTPVNAQSTIYWEEYSYRLKPKSCETLEGWSKRASSLSLTQPLGKLSMAAKGKDLLGAFDLANPPITERPIEWLEKQPIIIKDRGVNK